MQSHLFVRQVILITCFLFLSLVACAPEIETAVSVTTALPAATAEASPLPATQTVTLLEQAPTATRPATSVPAITPAVISASDGTTVSRTLLAEIDASWVAGTAIVSDDMQRLAWVAQTGQQQVVFLNGVAGKPYDTVSYLTFSPDSQRLMYVARSGNQQFVVVNELEGKPYDSADNQFMFSAFSPDSQHFQYAAAEGGRQFIIIDGQEGESYDVVSPLGFSPDSQHSAYLATMGNAQFVVIDGQVSLPYDEIRDFRFSPDSQRMAYAAASAGQWFLVVDGEEGMRHEDVHLLGFSPDSRRVAYMALANDGYHKHIVVDGVAGNAYVDFTEPSMPLFSPDSQHVAYQAEKPYSEVEPGGRVVVFDGVEGKPYDWLTSSLVFSSDSQHLAYTAMEYTTAGAKSYLVLDGQEVIAYDVPEASHPGESPLFRPHFSPDSQRLAYLLNAGQQWLWVVDGEEGKPYEGIGDLIYSPDSQHIAYAALEDGQQFVVVDGSEGQRYEAVLAGSYWGVANDGPLVKSSVWWPRMQFETSNILRYLALDENRLYLVTHMLP